MKKNYYLWSIIGWLVWSTSWVMAVEPTRTSPRTVALPSWGASFITSAVAPASDAQMAIVSDSSSSERQKARSVFAALDAENQYQDSLSSFEDLRVLPIGIRKKVGNNTIELAITKGTIYANKAELTVYIRMTMPVSDPNSSAKERQLFFGADQVGITRSGGLTGDFRAVLLGDFILPLRSFTIILKGGGGLAPNGQVNGAVTYAQFSCGSGFKEARLVADVVFPRDVLVPLDPSQNFEPFPSNQRVRASFDFFSTKGLHDVLISLTFNTPFAVANHERFAFVVSNVSLDLSTVNNPTNFTTPQGYPVATQDPTWQGVYIQQFSLILPPEFKKKTTGERVGLTAQNVLIDKLGFTGTVSAGIVGQPVLPLDQGDASGWKFGVDRFSVSFMTNKLVGGSFAGRISLPVNPDESGALAYEAAIEQSGNYRLSVANLTDLNFKFMRAKATIYRGSEVTLAVVDGKFKPRAVLHGAMGIYSNLGDSDGTPIDTTKNNTLTFKGIRFENLVLQTESPRLSFGMLAYERSGSNMANFPVVLEELSAKTENNSILIGLGISVNLMKSGEGKGFNGRAFLTLEAQEVNGTWKFVGIRRPIDIALDASVSAFELQGRIQLYEDETERGFKGAIKLKIKPPNKEILVCARAVFGYNFVDQERYWYVDGLASGLEIPIAGPLVLDGFAGGLYSKFRPIGTGGTAATSRDCDGPNTGIPYRYDKTVGLGFRAAVLLKVKNSENAFRGRVGFEIVLNRNYGISTIGFYGHGELMVSNPDIASNTAQLTKNFKNVAKTSNENSDKPISQPEMLRKASSIDSNAVNSRPAGAIAFWVGLVWNLDKGELHGEAEAYANIGSVMRGIGPYGRIGRVELHFDAQKWYIHVGKPTDKLGVMVGFGPVVARTGMYLMVGHGVPNQLPAPPVQVTQLIQVPTSSLTRPASDAQQILDGKGFAMGLDINVSTGPLQFAALYGQFGVGAGVDFLARKYNSFTCGYDAGSNGVYAVGQFYAYVQGEIGLRVGRRTFTIFNAGVAGLMQGGFPNPAWFSGSVGGRYSVLGGLVKDKFNFNVKLGTPCQGI